MALTDISTVFGVGQHARGCFYRQLVVERLSFRTGAIIALPPGKHVYKNAFLADKGVFSSISIEKSVSLAAIRRTKPITLRYQEFMGLF